MAAYPGAEVLVGAELPGTITRVLVQEKSPVRKGDLLIEFRGDAIRASAEEAVARVAQADAETVADRAGASTSESAAGAAAGCGRNQGAPQGPLDHRASPSGRGRCRVSSDRGRIRPHARSVADQRRGHLTRCEPRRDRQPGYAPAPDRRPHAITYRGRGRCV